MEFEIGELPDLFQNIYLLMYLYYSIKFLYIYLRPVDVSFTYLSQQMYFKKQCSWIGMDAINY